MSKLSIVYAMCTVSLWADVIIMNNGDKISGVVKHLKNDILHIQTSYAGELKISTLEISRLTLDKPAPLLNKGGQLTQKQIFGKPQAEDKTEAYPIKEIRILYPTVVDLGEKGSLEGRASFALKVENDSDPTDEIDVDVNLKYQRVKHNFSTHFQLEYDKDEDVPTKLDWYSANQYAYYYRPQYYLTYWYTLKSEKYDGLELRQTTGPGWGYKFETSPRTYSTTEFGVSYNYEDYVDQPDQEFISLNWALNFERLLFSDRLTFYHTNTSGISVEDPDKQLWHSWTGFRVPVIRGIITSFEYEIDYDSQPALRERDTNTTVRIKLGKEW